MHTARLVQMTDQQPDWPQQFKAKPDEEVERNTAQPHHKELQVDQVIGAEESKINRQKLLKYYLTSQ